MTPGTFLFVVALTLLVVGFFLCSSVFKKRAFRHILRLQKSLYGGPHEWRRVEAGDFPHLDQDYYDGTQAVLESHGFTLIGDFENLTLAGSAGNPRCFLRIMSGMDGTVTAAFYQVAAQDPAQMQFLTATRFVEFETESIDGRFFITSNTESADKLGSPPKITAILLPAGTPVEEVWTRFLQGLEKRLADTPAFMPRRLDTWEAVRASQDREQTLRSEFRKQQGYLTRDEFLAMGGRARDYELFRKVVAEDEAN